MGVVVPRSVMWSARAGRPTAPDAVPPLALSPLAWATVAVDELTMSAAYLLTRRGAELVTAAAVEDAGEAVARLRDAGVVDDPMLLHPEPRQGPEVRLTRRTRAGIDFEHLSWRSDYAPPVELPGGDRWDEREANRTAHAYLLRHGDRPRPWLLVLHGHRMGEPRDVRMLGSRRLQHELGVDVAHLVLPMHGPRGRGGAHPFPGIDPIVNLLGMAQAIWDARVLLGWLRQDSDQPIGAFGISLGGHTAALLAGIDDGLRCVVAGVPVCDMSEMLADNLGQRWGQDMVAASHVCDPSFVELSGLVSPLRFAPKVPHDRRFVYAAVGDRMVTPQQALALWHHWEQPRICWLQGGHILNNVRASRRFVTAALRDSGLSRATAA